MGLKFGAKESFVFVISMLLLTDIAILLNVPFLRQIFGFLFLTLLPGLMILQILKLNKIGLTEKSVLSIGLSISFLMLYGLLINNLSLSLGYKAPLSTSSLLILFNLAFIVLAIFGYKMNNEPIFTLPNFNLSTTEKTFLIVPIFLPALSILGTHFMKTADNNTLLMILLFLIPAYVVFVSFFNAKFPKRLYPVVIFLISISILLIFMLRFPHICGHDVHMEYGMYFQTTLDNSHWGVFERPSILDACLSISLLPTIFQSIMNVSAQESLFKGIYVSICSFTPVVIYLIAKKYIGVLYAFLASFLFISQIQFMSSAGSPRTSLAIFFAALAIMVLLNDKTNPLKKRFLFIAFMLTMVISHYSTTYIFFFIMLGCFVCVEILSKKYTFKKFISGTLVILLGTFIFFWYSQVTEAAFSGGVAFIENTFTSLNRFFIEESRAEVINKQLLGKELAIPILSHVYFVLTWCTFILIGIGVLTVVLRYKEMVVISNEKLKNFDFLKSKFEVEFLVLTLLCAGLLIFMILLPHISTGYGIQRLYSLMLIILSVCFVIGGITLSKTYVFIKQTFKKRHLPKKQKRRKNILQNPVRNGIAKENSSQVLACWIILMILIPYSMFMTGAMHQIFGSPVSLNLNSEGKSFDREYIYDSECCSAKWLKNNANKTAGIYTGARNSRFIFLSQANNVFGRQQPIIEGEKIGGYLYLGYYNIIDDKLLGYYKVNKLKILEIYNMSDRSDIFVGMHRIYSNGCSEVWR